MKFVHFCVPLRGWPRGQRTGLPFTSLPEAKNIALKPFFLFRTVLLSTMYWTILPSCIVTHGTFFTWLREKFGYHLSFIIILYLTIKLISLIFREQIVIPELAHIECLLSRIQLLTGKFVNWGIFEGVVHQVAAGKGFTIERWLWSEKEVANKKCMVSAIWNKRMDFFHFFH